MKTLAISFTMVCITVLFGALVYAVWDNGDYRVAAVFTMFWLALVILSTKECERKD